MLRLDFFKSLAEFIRQTILKVKSIGRENTRRSSIRDITWFKPIDFIEMRKRLGLCK